MFNLHLAVIILILCCSSTLQARDVSQADIRAWMLEHPDDMTMLSNDGSRCMMGCCDPQKRKKWTRLGEAPDSNDSDDESEPNVESPFTQENDPLFRYVTPQALDGFATRAVRFQAMRFGSR